MKKKPQIIDPKPLPFRSVLDAFFPKAMTISGIVLQPISALHYLFLQEIGSPLIAPEKTDGKMVVRATSRDVMAGIFVCALKAEDLAQVAAKGVDAFWAELPYFEARLDMAGLLQAPAKIMAHIDQAFDNAMAAAADPGEDDDAPFVAPDAAGTRTSSAS